MPATNLDDLTAKAPRGYELKNPLELTPRVLRIAWLVADDRLRDEEIAREGHISMQTLQKWKYDAGFKQQVKEYRTVIYEQILANGVANKEWRIREAQERLERMRALILARASAGADKQARGVATDPGEGTGLIAEAPAGRTTIMATDAALLREIRELEKQIAEELGQYRRGLDVTTGGAPISFTIPMSDSEPAAENE